MAYECRKAKRLGTKACMAIMGPSGSGKTVGALILGKALCPPGKKVVLIETQPGQSDLYGATFDFFIVDLAAPFTPERCSAAIRAALKENAGVVIFDSLSHEWMGKGGILQMVEDTPGTNSFAKWKQPSRSHGEFIEEFTGLAKTVHFIATIRAKDKYVIDKVVDKFGNEKSAPKKIGEAPIQREGIEYEFPITLMLDQETHRFKVWGDKTNGIFFSDEERVITPELGKRFAEWCKGSKGYEPLLQIGKLEDEEGAGGADEDESAEPQVHKAAPLKRR
jgi:hypothetical protein